MFNVCVAEGVGFLRFWLYCFDRTEYDFIIIEIHIALNKAHLVYYACYRRI